MAQEEEERETIRQQAERAADPSASGGVSGATPPRMDIDAGDDSRDGPPAYDVVGASPVTTFVPSSQRDGDQDMNNTPSQVSRAQRRAKARARRMKAAAVKALGSFEGRDRVLVSSGVARSRSTEEQALTGDSHAHSPFSNSSTAWPCSRTTRLAQ